MKKKQPLWIKICAVLAVIAVVAVAGYFTVFYQADVLKIENGRYQAPNPPGSLPTMGRCIISWRM